MNHESWSVSPLILRITTASTPALELIWHQFLCKSCLKYQKSFKITLAWAKWLFWGFFSHGILEGYWTTAFSRVIGAELGWCCCSWQVSGTWWGSPIGFWLPDKPCLKSALVGGSYTFRRMELMIPFPCCGFFMVPWTVPDLHSCAPGMPSGTDMAQTMPRGVHAPSLPTPLRGASTSTA